jgi:hypothetical protein
VRGALPASGWHRVVLDAPAREWRQVNPDFYRNPAAGPPTQAAQRWDLVPESFVRQEGGVVSGREGEFSESQREQLQGRRADQDRTLAAIQHLEEALGTAAPGRETAWRDEVLAALAVLDEATAQEHNNAARPDSLLADIKRSQPRLRPRVRGVQVQYGQLRDRIAALRHELGDQDELVIDFADLRHRVASLLTAFRHQRARESDLIYEAYYDAFNADLRTER